MAQTPEGRVKQAVRKVLQAHNCYYFFVMSNGMGRTGIPDIVGCIPTVITPDMVGKTIGQFVAIETKAPGKLRNVTANQRRELGMVAETGGLAILADKAETVDQAIKGRPLVGDVIWGE